MSEPQTNMEIEDVLTSIRRLVSDNEWTRPAQPAPERAESQPAETVTESVDDKFVLTPALRVVDDADAAEQTAQTFEEPVETPVEAELSIAGNGMSDLERMIAELEAAVSGAQAAWQPDEEDIEDLGQAPRPFPAKETYIEDIEEEATVTEDADTADVLSANLHDSEAPDADEDQHLDSDDPDLEEIEDHIEDFLENSPLIDEEVLRKMVTEIVRSELQGALGERITRNVRKLVRREIYRILSSQDFE